MKIQARKQEAVDPEIRVGDMVRVTGQEAAGEVIDLKGKNVTLAFGILKSTAKLDQLEKIQGEEAG